MNNYTLIDTASRKYLFPGLNSGKFGLYIKENVRLQGGGCWRMSKQLRNLFDNTYYNISDIECIIYDKNRKSTTVVFNGIIDKYEAISFREEFNSLRIDYHKPFGNIIHTERVDCDEYVYCYYEDLFNAFCLLPNIKGNAVITLDGHVYQDENLMRFYTTDNLRALQEIQQ